jgi:branched-chain amino acid transport system substrate-binding protein
MRVSAPPAGDATVVDSFAQEFERNHGQVVARFRYRETDPDPDRIAAEVMAGHPQAVLVAGAGAPVSAIIAALHARGYRGAVLTTSGFGAPKFVRAAGRRAEGVLLALPIFDVASPLPAVASFVESFSARHGEPPDVWAAYGYDAVHLLATALERSRGPADVWSAMRGLSGYEGVTGSIQFDEGGAAAAFPRVHVVSGGEVRELTEMGDRQRRDLFRRLAAVVPDRSSRDRT